MYKIYELFVFFPPALIFEAFLTLHYGCAEEEPAQPSCVPFLHRL